MLGVVNQALAYIVIMNAMDEGLSQLELGDCLNLPNLTKSSSTISDCDGNLT